MTNSGEYGGRVLRGFSGDGRKFIAGAILNPSDVENWPLANKLALHKEGKVDWFGPPIEAEEQARQAGAPAKARGKVATTAKTTPAPKAATSRRIRG